MFRSQIVLFTALIFLVLTPAGRSAEPSQGGVIPYFVDGGGGEWTTSLSFTCLTDNGCMFTVNFIGANGKHVDLPVRIIAGDRSQNMTASYVQITSSTRVTTLIETTGRSPSIVSGAVDVVSDSLMIGHATFRQRIPGRADFEASVPMESRPRARSFVLPFDNRSGFSTGVALVNLRNNTRVHVFIEGKDFSDRVIFTGFISLGELNSTTFDLASRFPETAGRAGVLVFSTEGAYISGTGFRFNPSGPFTTLPLFSVR